MKSKEAKQRQQIFLNTLDMIRSDKSLSEAVEASIEALSVYGENEYPRLADNIKLKNTVISVTEHRSFEAAALIHEKAPDRRIAVLNIRLKHLNISTNITAAEPTTKPWTM